MARCSATSACSVIRRRPISVPASRAGSSTCDLVPTADFQRDPGLDRSIARFQSVFSQVLDSGAIDYLSPGTAAAEMIGSGPLLNIFLLGAACQRGLLPLGLKSLEEAVGGGRGGTKNLLAFRLGRLAIADRAALDLLLGSEAPPVPLASLPIDALVARGRELLTDYQSTSYADRYERFVAAIRRQDPQGRFAHAVALNLLKLMRYKDEYEVARLYAQPAFRRRLERAFEGDFALQFNLAPPLLPLRRTSAGEPRKIRLGGWTMAMFRVLQHFKLLRGTPFDPFGYLGDRRLERELVRDYRATIEAIASRVGDSDYEIAVEIAALPDEIRGYGQVKERSIAAARTKQAALLDRLGTGVSHPVAVG
jgi:indolepyruvate ferredoxin oxidoreductase